MEVVNNRFFPSDRQFFPNQIFLFFDTPYSVIKNLNFLFENILDMFFKKFNAKYFLEKQKKNIVSSSGNHLKIIV